MVHHFKTIQWKKRERSLKLTPFKTPSQQRWKHKECPSRWTPVTWMPDPWYLMKPVHITHPSITITITSVAILTQVAFIFTSCISFHPENHQWSPSEDSTPTGRKRHQSEPAFIRPQDIDRGLTPRLSALLQETSPLAPYKWERSAKARARQAFSTMHWTPFKTLLRKSVIWCKLTPFKTPVHLYVDTTPLYWLLSRPLWFIIKLTHFKTLYVHIQH